jgi:cell division protein FtsI/penicillin-binding protein 2
LRRAITEYGAHGGSVLVIDPHSAEVLAMASGPAPVDRAGPYDPDSWRDRAVCDLFEPGSTMKPLTAIAALRRGVVDFNTHIFAERGQAGFGAAGIIHDSHASGDGWLTFPQAFAKSSNICFAKVARALTSEAMYDELRAFGFGSATGLGLPGEESGQLALPRGWSARTRLCLGYGQEISVTAVQLAGLYTTIANGGRLQRPRLVSQLLGPDGRTRRSFETQAVRRLLDGELATQVQQLCRLVVKEGTGVGAQVEGMPTAGKTGTAQKAVDGHYARRYVASFGGFVPADDPRYVCLVVLDEPRNPYYYGGLSAAPTFKRIVEAMMRTTPYLEPQADHVTIVRATDLQDREPWQASPQRLASLDVGAPSEARPRSQVASRALRRPVQRASILLR